MFYLLHYPMLGVMTAVDTLLATTFGAGHLRAYADWTQVSLVAVTALTVPVMVGRRGMIEDKMCVSNRPNKCEVTWRFNTTPGSRVGDRTRRW